MLRRLKKIGINLYGFFLVGKDYFAFRRQLKKNKVGDIGGIKFMINDRFCSNGSLDIHYFLQDIYVAKKIIEFSPLNHYDVGSRVDGFIAHLLAGYKGTVTTIDIRPLGVELEGLEFIQADATNLNGISDNSIESISSLHAVEHFGLGRYGDSISVTACYDAMKSLQRVVKKGGRLYFSVPIGKEDTIIFNAHRWFAPKTILEQFNQMSLVSFAYIHDFRIFEQEKEQAVTAIKNGQLKISDYDCGIFVFEKV